MITQITTVEELKALIVEQFFNKQDKVTKVSDGSVISGIFYGVAKVAQKAIKDIAIIESHIFPESAYGQYLDIIAERLGIAPRFGSAGSSTYLRIVGLAGTTYLKAVHQFSSTTGQIFELDSDITIPSFGYIYAKVRSQDVGEKTNVPAFSITSVAPLPTGHKYVTNEWRVSNGRDIESDDLFLKRIKEGPNILARGTLAYLTQAAMKVNENILRLVFEGTDPNGENILSVVSQNGIDFSPTELGDILSGITPYLSLYELPPYQGGYVGLKLQNPQWYPIDISVRLELEQGVAPVC